MGSLPFIVTPRFIIIGLTLATCNVILIITYHTLYFLFKINIFFYSPEQNASPSDPDILLPLLI